MGKITGRLAAIAVFVFAQAAFASAAELNVYSTIGVKSAIEELAPKFEKATGNKLGAPSRGLSKRRRKAMCPTCSSSRGPASTA